MYVAEGNRVYVVQNGVRQLFLTVHETDTGGTMSPESQAVSLVKILTNLFKVAEQLGD